ncbi:MAG: hypothetical protein QW279_10555 [Candidatus Jordarchaeaceae archaeon]
MKRHAEELKGWLTKWFGMQVGVITGFVFVEIDDLEDFLKALERDPAKAYTLCTYRGPLLDPLNSFPVIKLLNLLLGEIVFSLIYRAGLSCILVLDFDVERFCCVCDGKEKWACVFRTKERDTKTLIAHMFSILGFEERSYRYMGLRIFREGVSEWLKGGAESGLFNYVWVRNEFEKGELVSRESNLLTKSIQNWFEDKAFSSCIFTWWFSKVGVWGLNYLNKMTCVFSSTAKESDNREFSEILGEIYDAYLKGIEVKEEETKRQAVVKEAEIVKENIGEEQTSAGLMGREVAKEVTAPLTKVETVTAESGEESDKAKPFDLFGKRFMELEERVKNLEREVSRIKAVEGKLGQIESRIANLGKIGSGGLQDTVKLLEGKTSVIENMVEEIRATMNVLNEQLGEFKRRELEIIRTIKEFRSDK